MDNDNPDEEMPTPKQLADLVAEIVKIRRAEVAAAARTEAERRKIRAEYLAQRAGYEAKVARMRALEFENAQPINAIERCYEELLRRGLVPLDEGDAESDTPNLEDDPFGDVPEEESPR